MTEPQKRPKKAPAKKTPAKKASGRTTAAKSTEAKASTDIATLLAAKKKPIMDFPISTDFEVADAAVVARQVLEEVEQRVKLAELRAERLKTDVDPDLLDERDDAKEEADRLTAEADAKTIKFKMQALPRAVLIALYKDYPPTERQKRIFKDELKKAKEPTTTRLDFNEDTFPPVLIYMSMIEPNLSEDEVNTMWHGPECEVCDGEGCDDTEDSDCKDGRRPDLGVWSKAELDGLFLAASNINKLIK